MNAVQSAALPGVWEIKLDVHEDFRGTYKQLWGADWRLLMVAAIDGFRGRVFVEDDASVSRRGVLRGIHSDNLAWKLITCLYGRIYLVIVNCDHESPGFGKWKSFILSESNGVQVLVPPKHGVAHLVLSDHAVFHYKQSEVFNPARQATFRFDDPRFCIWWPVKEPLLSRRDETGAYVD